MRARRGIGACALLLGCISSVRSFGFSIAAGQVECFHETVTASDHVAGEWRVSKMVDDPVQKDVANNSTHAHKKHGLPVLDVRVRDHEA